MPGQHHTVEQIVARLRERSRSSKDREAGSPRCRKGGLFAGVYCTMYMAIRTQIYITEEQRARLRERAARNRVTVAELVREAIDRYVSGEDDLEATFGAAPDLAPSIPSRD